MYQADEKRYETMQYNRCGNSGLLLPELSLGLWHNFGTHCDYKNMKALCFTAQTSRPAFGTPRHY